MTYFLIRVRYGYWDPEEEEIVEEFTDKAEAEAEAYYKNLNAKQCWYTVHARHDDPADLNPEL